MVKEKGITKINGTLGFGEYSSSIDLNAFHSITNSVGLMGNYSSLYLDGNTLTAFDLGAGYFKPFDKKTGFEVYSTVGYGSLKLSSYDWWTGETYYYGSTPVFRFAIQPDVFYTGKNFEGGFGFRLHYFSYESTNLFYDYQTNASNHLMFEPTLKIAVGGEKVKFSLQGTYSTKVNEGYLSYDQFMVSVGMTFKFKSKSR